MKTVFASSFEKDLLQIRDKRTKDAIAGILLIVEAARHLRDIPGLKKLKAGGHYFRIRVAEYRLGLAIEGDVVRFIRVLHRREVYRYFP